MEGSIGFIGTLTGDISGDGGGGVTPHVTATAQVDSNTGTPTVTVTRTGTDENPNFNFAFQNLKGETGAQGIQGIQGLPGSQGIPGERGPRGFTGNTGETGPQGEPGESPVVSASATIDSSVGTPSVSVTKTGPQLQPNFTFAFHNLKGEPGEDSTVPGPAGPQGPAGPAGQGVAQGGTTGQILAKAGAGDYLTEWINPTPDALPIISDEYDDHTAYSVGDYCIYENTLYKCNTDITPYEVWDSSHWDSCTVGEEIATINSSLAQSAWTETSSGSGCYYCKFNGIVFVKIHNISVTGRSSLSLGTLPEGFRPTQQINTAIVGGSYREYTGQLQISSAGAISLYCNTTANYWGFVAIPPF